MPRSPRSDPVNLIPHPSLAAQDEVAWWAEVQKVLSDATDRAYEAGSASQWKAVQEARRRKLEAELELLKED